VWCDVVRTSALRAVRRGQAHLGVRLVFGDVAHGIADLLERDANTATLLRGVVMTKRFFGTKRRRPQCRHQIGAAGRRSGVAAPSVGSKLSMSWATSSGTVVERCSNFVAALTRLGRPPSSQRV
jgi:hypothetical protein